MAFYVKVKKTVADKLGVTDNRNATADGHVLLWQADIAGVEGDTIFERAAKVGGVCLTAQEAHDEIDGTISTPLPSDEKPMTQVSPSDPVVNTVTKGGKA